MAFKISKSSPKRVYRSSSNSNQDTASSLVKKAKSKVAKSSKFEGDSVLREAAKLDRFLSRHLDTKVGKHILGTIGYAAVALANNSKRKLNYAMLESLRNSDSGSLAQQYIIRFKSGIPSSKSVTDAARTSGSIDFERFDTLKNMIDNRKDLESCFGFNQKRIDFLGCIFYPTVKDYNGYYGFSSFNPSPDSKVVPYGLAISEYSQLSIKNTNFYHGVKVKLHLVKILDDDVSYHELFEKVFSADPKKPLPGAMDPIYQIGNHLKSNTKSSVITTLDSSFSICANFRVHAKIVKTFTKQLNPGDVFEFRHTTSCGPGIRIDVGKAFISTAAGGNQPSSYMYVVESFGLPCEGVRIKDKAKFQGTCPGDLIYESKKAISLVTNRIYSAAEDYELKSNSLKNMCSIKYHSRRVSDTQAYNVSFEKIGVDSDNQKDKELYVLSTTLAHPVTSKSEKSNLKYVNNNYYTINSDGDDKNNRLGKDEFVSEEDIEYTEDIEEEFDDGYQEDGGEF